MTVVSDASELKLNAKVLLRRSDASVTVVSDALTVAETLTRRLVVDWADCSAEGTCYHVERVDSLSDGAVASA